MLNVVPMVGDNGINGGLLPRSDLQNGYQPDASGDSNGTGTEHGLNGNASPTRPREPAHAGNGNTGPPLRQLISQQKSASIACRLTARCMRHHCCVCKDVTTPAQTNFKPDWPSSGAVGLLVRVQLVA